MSSFRRRHESCCLRSATRMIGMLEAQRASSRWIAVEELLLVANQTASADFRYFEALTAAGHLLSRDDDRPSWVCRSSSKRCSIPRGFSRMRRVFAGRADGWLDLAVVRDSIGPAKRSCSHLLENRWINKSFGSVQVLKDLQHEPWPLRKTVVRHRPVRFREVDAAAFHQPAGTGRQRRYLLWRARTSRAS